MGVLALTLQQFQSIIKMSAASQALLQWEAELEQVRYLRTRNWKRKSWCFPSIIYLFIYTALFLC